MRAPALDDLRDLVARPGPFASVYLPVAPEQPDGDHRLAIRWHHARAALVDAGAADQVVSKLEASLPAAGEVDGAALAMLAAADGTLIVETLDVALRHEVARWAPLADLAPIIDARQRAVPHLVVLVDRAGADLVAVRPRRTAEPHHVEGDSSPIGQRAPGGWSAPRYHRRAETSWDENASQIGHAVVELADEVRPSFIAVGGDVRAKALLRTHLPHRIDRLVHEVAATRHADGSDDAFAEDVDRLVADAGAAVTAHLLSRARDQLGQGRDAVSGPANVLAVLADGRVEVLLAHDDPDDERTAWFGAEAGEVAVNRQQLVARGVDDPREGRLLDVAIAGALRTGADVHVVPDAARDLTALLRWSVEGT